MAISKISKSDIAVVKQFFQILVLFKSRNHSHLANAAVNLCIPRDYIILMLLSKNALDL